MGLNTPNSSDAPSGITLDGNYISFGGIKGPSLEYCSILRDQQFWDEHRKVLESWISNTTPEEVFKYGRGDYNNYLFRVHDKVLENEIEQKRLGYIWSKTPELQRKYPNFEGISRLTEADKINGIENPILNQDNNPPWISLVAPNHLSIYTRGGENDEFTEHFYTIGQDGTAEHRWSKTQGELKLALQQHEIQSRARNIIGNPFRTERPERNFL